MAQHKSNNEESAINKTFIFKAKCDKNDVISLWEPAAKEYGDYYNEVSKWIADNLITMKIGDLAQYITNKKSAYYIAVTAETKKDLPLYRIFQKGFSSQCADNALYCAIKSINPENYKGNSLGIGESDYRRFGYIQSVVSNFRTKMSSLKATVKWKKFDVNNVDDETLKIQTIYDVDKYGIETAKEFKELIETLKTRVETPQLNDTIARLECLCDYYSKNEKAINNEIETMAIADLQKFGGCQRKSLNAFTIHKQDSLMEKVGNTSFRLQLPFRKKTYVINLLGNRQVVNFVNGKRVDLIDIAENHGDLVTFNIKNGVLFVHLTSPIVFDKDVRDIRNVVGIDVNIKHSMLATSIKDVGNVKGYINLYKELLNDDEFVSTCNESELALYRQMSENVNFGILETDSLFERIVNQSKGGCLKNKLIRRELAMQKVFERITKTNKDQNIVDYVNYVKMMRAKCKASYILKEKYYEKQKEYDVKMGFTDESTESKETMDKRREEFPFVNTDTAKELLVKQNNIRQDIIGCRDNIVTYAFNVFKNNEYDTLSVEYLDSSQFDKRRIPTPKSLLKYHKFEGKTKDEVENMMKSEKLSNAYYTFKYENDVVSDIGYSDEGNLRRSKLNFGNWIIKAIHFADIKDKFVQLSNNNKMNIVFCPSAFSSQMDSITHTLYYVEKITKNKKGKEKKKYVLANKKMVRTQQETHINGLNADYNSACNLKYIALNYELRDKMTDRFKASKKIKTMYNIPAYNIKSNFKKNLSAKTIQTFRELGHYRDGKINEDGMFVEILE